MIIFRLFLGQELL